MSHRLAIPYSWIQPKINCTIIIDDETLSVPHPRLSERAFVLLPWCDLAPDWRHPVQDITIRELAAQIILTNQKIQKYVPLITS